MVTNNPILQMFARSPFKPMQEHIAKAQEAAAELKPFLQAVLNNDWETAQQIQHRIAVIEGEADDMKRAIRQNLPGNLFLPVPRSDLLDLLRMQDKVANRAKDIAGMMLGRKMQIPEQIQDELGRFLETAIQTTEQAVIALNELDELLAAGFRGHEVKVVEKLIDELDRLEHENDEQERKLRNSLFNIERDVYAVDVIFLYRIIDDIGDLANYAQHVGSRLQLLLAR
ncbi:Phosphate transport regulator [Nitrincola lacisaponensis]|uniref:Phosphate transport regulator n=1 Tax=Nitrincola lacisaponensis TaxID=267850 RepID=A0A063Y4N4_9GAMM|nr:TIGR00153 family protein [Nitrincola lacisaponensis]KDE40100.1 Phosphate transport regulator [Nitrincola lacisaponensis]